MGLDRSAPCVALCLAGALDVSRRVLDRARHWREQSAQHTPRSDKVRDPSSAGVIQHVRARRQQGPGQGAGRHGLILASRAPTAATTMADRPTRPNPFAAAIAGFDVRALKATETRITTRDGRVFKETRVDTTDDGASADGGRRVEFVGQGTPPSYIAEMEGGFRSLVPMAWDGEGRWAAHAPDSGDETAAAGDAQRSACETLAVVTWNVWFMERNLRVRADALLAIVRAQRADVVCFQEVTQPFLDAMLEADWVRDDYVVSDARGATVVPYGVCLMVRRSAPGLRVCSMRKHLIPTNMGRTLLVAELDVGVAPRASGPSVRSDDFASGAASGGAASGAASGAGADFSTGGGDELAAGSTDDVGAESARGAAHHKVLVCTVHLESMDNDAMRSAQLKAIVEVIDTFRADDGGSPERRHAILCGDMNFGSTSQLQLWVEGIPGVVDAWNVCRDAGTAADADASEDADAASPRRPSAATCDEVDHGALVSAALATSAGDAERRLATLGRMPVGPDASHVDGSRIDRVFVMSSTLSPASMRRLGVRPIGSGVVPAAETPSDHFGLACTLHWGSGSTA